jgi:hypothetical protein
MSLPSEATSTQGVSAAELTQTPLSPLVRDILASLAASVAVSLGAPGFGRDLVEALRAGQVAEARAILRGFGHVALVPTANLPLVAALGHALETAFSVVEAHAAREAQETPLDTAEQAVRVAALMEHVRPPRPKRATARRS